MRRSLVGVTLLLVGGVVLLLGTAVVTWLTGEDVRRGRADARAQQDDAEREMRLLARDLVDEAEAASRRLVEGADRRIRLWIAEEPLAIYRDPAPPHAIDVEALRRGLTAEVRKRSLAERDHVEIVNRVMAEAAQARIERVAAEQKTGAEADAEAAAAARRDSLALRLALLLVLMAVLLGWTLYALVIAPVGRLRSSVQRIAGGDLLTPVGGARWRTRELASLAADVDAMRDTIRRATLHLEEEVARKTTHLARALEERTRTLEELRAAQDRLVQAEKMAGLGTLAGGVAHEFNNLLGGILGCLESARADTKEPEVLEDLAMAERTARRATGLVQALLGVARPGSGSLGPVDLGRVVEDVLGAVHAAAARRGVVVVREVAGAPTVRGDEGQLHQVALNLVTNALQAVDDGERVVVRMAVEGRHGVLEVRDAGPGIPPEDQARLFEPFFTRRTGGTGLGLFVSYGIVERHGGRIEVGEAPEGGARFTVRIPLDRLEPAGPGPSAPPPASPPPLSSAPPPAPPASPPPPSSMPPPAPSGPSEPPGPRAPRAPPGPSVPPGPPAPPDAADPAGASRPAR